MCAATTTPAALDQAHNLPPFGNPATRGDADPEPPITPTLWMLQGIPIPQAAVAYRARCAGSEVFYVGTPARLHSVRSSLWLRTLLPERDLWKLPPLAHIVRSAQKAMPDLLLDPSERSVVLGVMCLPPPVVDALVSREARGTPKVLLLDGVSAQDPNVAQALRGIRALCEQVNVELYCFA